jgi:hypothetical protein
MKRLFPDAAEEVYDYLKASRRFKGHFLPLFGRADCILLWQLKCDLRARRLARFVRFWAAPKHLPPKRSASSNRNDLGRD